VIFWREVRRSESGVAGHRSEETLPPGGPRDAQDAG
jgi:hypothetical protein